MVFHIEPKGQVMVERKIFTALAAIFTICFFAFPSSGEAGGFSSSRSYVPHGTVSAKALARNYTHLTSPSARVHTNNHAKVKHHNINNKVLEGIATAGNQIEILAMDGDCKCGGNGHIKVEQKSSAKTKIYLKGKNILAKARAKNHVKVKVKGKLYFENEQTAIAMGRFTPLGTQTQAYAINQSKLEAKGLVRLESGNIAVSSAKVSH